MGGIYMKIDKTLNGDQIIINVEGHLDTNTSPQLESVLNEILDGKRVNLVIDFSKLEYLSSAGLRVLLTAQKKTNEVVGNLVIKHVNQTIMEVFRLTGFSEFLTIDNN